MAKDGDKRPEQSEQPASVRVPSAIGVDKMNLAVVILSLLTWSSDPFRLATHIANHPMGEEVRASEIAGYFTKAAKAHRLRLSALVAMGKHEGYFDSSAKSRVGALGMLRLHPRWKWGKGWRQECQKEAWRMTDEACEAAHVMWAAKALRESLDRCGNYTAAIGAYRSGHCIEGPKSQATMRLARRIEAQLRST